MNKALSVLLAAALLTALLASCGDAPPPAQETPTLLPTAAPAPSETPAPEQKAFSRGKIEGRVYESGFLSLRFTAPEGWAFASDGELAQRMGLTLDIVGEDVFGDAAELAKAIAGQAVLIDMAAAAPDSGANVSLAIEDTEATGSGALTEADCASLLREQLLAITDLRYEPEEPETGFLAGRPCAVLLVHLPDYGMAQRFCLLREGKYMIQIALTGAEGDLPDADALFAPLE